MIVDLFPKRKFPSLRFTRYDGTNEPNPAICFAQIRDPFESVLFIKNLPLSNKEIIKLPFGS
jgi:hypothetical protein